MERPKLRLRDEKNCFRLREEKTARNRWIHQSFFFEVQLIFFFEQVGISEIDEADDVSDGDLTE